MLVLESDTEETPELEIEADISVVHLYEDHPVVIAGRDHLFINILNKDFRVSAASFFQVNTKMAEKMVNTFHSACQFPFLPLYWMFTGAGLFSKFLRQNTQNHRH